MTLKTVFSINLNEKIIPGLVSVGRFDGLNPCIVAATNSDKVLLHNPLRRSQSSDSWLSLAAAETDVFFLNINQTVKSLTVGQLKPDSDKEFLVLGTPTSILVYDVVNNVDLFYRDIPDGANAVVVGTVGTVEVPIAIAGGNFSIQGFDHEGNERYWTITGDNITTLALADLDNDGNKELIVGSEDYDIRIFKEDAIFMEINETDSVKLVWPIREDCFGYALNNGTVGVYYRKDRLWRIKSKNQAVCLFSYDVNGDGAPELVIGWSNGKLDARNMETGEMIFKDNFGHSIAGIMAADYNLDGSQELIVCSENGDVKGYLPIIQQETPSAADLVADQEMLRELMKRKQNLILELRNYESINLSGHDFELPNHSKASTEEDEYGAIPADTQLKSALVLSTNEVKPSVKLTLQTTNDTIIRLAVIFAEGIFKGESHVTHPLENEVANTLSIALRPPKNVSIDLHVKSMVGYKGSHHFHVFELSRHLPRFSMFSLRNPLDESQKPKGFVKFSLNEKQNKVRTIDYLKIELMVGKQLLLWLNKNFLLVNEIEPINDLEITFTSLRDGKFLVLEMGRKTEEFTIRTDNMELAGDIIQSLAEFLNISDLQSTSEFPSEIDLLKKLIPRVNEMQAVRQRLGADIAENSVAVRGLIIRAEDARLLGEWTLVKQIYMDLSMLNRELMNGYQVRSQNHRDMVDSLRQINATIQKAANLRVGHSKAKLIQLCRLSIKENNLNSLFRIINWGEV